MRWRSIMRGIHQTTRIMGRLLLLAIRWMKARSILIARLKTNGQIDPSFHHTGKFASSFVSEYKYSLSAAAVVVQASNQIVIAGSVGPTKGSVHHFGIIRLNSNGLGDSTFGPSNGQTEVNFGVNVSVTAAAIIPDGEILVGGVGVQQMDMVLLKSNGIVDQNPLVANTGVQADENGRDVTSAPVFADSKSGSAWHRGGSLWFRAINFCASEI